MSDKPDFQGWTADVILRPEWAAKLGIDKTLRVAQANTTSGAHGDGAYTVPAGKALYITDMSFDMQASDLATNGDKAQHVAASIGLGGTIVHAQGGDGGGSHNFSTPIRADAGVAVGYTVFNNSAHTGNVTLQIHGYEVDA